MLLKKTIHKTKNLVQKALQNLKSHVFGGYQKLSRAPSMNLFSTRSINNPKLHKLEDFYRDFCVHLESDPNEPTTTPRKSKSHTILMKDENASDLEQRVLKTKKKKKEEKKGGPAEHKKANSNGLAQKMRELEMMDVHDVDHVLDVEEVLHYYSRLKSPIYQDLVDKFFMDMYSDFSVPKPSAKPTINTSMRRLGPLKI